MTEDGQRPVTIAQKELKMEFDLYSLHHTNALNCKQQTGTLSQNVSN